MVANTSQQAAARARAHRMVLRHDPLIGQRYVPDQRARVPFHDGGYMVRTNSLGFRSDLEFVPEKGDRPRIIFLGDSFIAGYGVDNDERFPEIAGEHLGVEVFNAGLTGSGTDQQVLAYEQYLADLECDLIVLGVMVENIERIKSDAHRTIDPHTGRHYYTPKPYFSFDSNDELTLGNVPVPRDRRPADQVDLYGRDDGTGLRQRLSRRAWSFLSDDRLAWMQSQKVHEARHRLQRLTRYQPYPDYRDENSNGWRLMAAIIERLVSAAAGTPVLVMPIPNTDHLRRIAPDPVYQDRFDSLADPSRGVHVVDVTTSMRQLPADELEHLTFGIDWHFSRRGNRAVGKIVADAIAGVTALDLGARGSSPTATSPTATPPTVAATRPEYTLGLSCFYHNSAAALLKDGDLVAAVEEERFTRQKADRGFPLNAVNYCLEEAGISQRDLTSVVYYDNAYLTFERLMHSQLAVGADGIETWERVVPSWIEQKLCIPDVIRTSLAYEGDVYHASHHRSHAASAFYMSPFEQAAVLTVDGVGEWSTATIGVGHGPDLQLLREMHFPHSVGLLYSAFTQFVGFKVNNGEYKMMGLAPYGDPVYANDIFDHIVDVKSDGSIELNLEYFEFLEGRTMTSPKFAELFGGPARGWDEPVTRRDMDISASIQEVTEEIVMRMATHAHEVTGQSRLCLAGGVALNCVANGKLLRKGIFDELWIQPAAGDSGAALGAALDLWHTHHGRPRSIGPDARSPQAGSYWGPEYSETEITSFLDSSDLPYERVDPGERASLIASFIDEGKVVGHLSGRAEFGPPRTRCAFHPRRRQESGDSDDTQPPHQVPGVLPTVRADGARRARRRLLRARHREPLYVDRRPGARGSSPPVRADH